MNRPFAPSAQQPPENRPRSQHLPPTPQSKSRGGTADADHSNPGFLEGAKLRRDGGVLLTVPQHCDQLHVDARSRESLGENEHVDLCTAERTPAGYLRQVDNVCDAAERLGA